MSEKPTKFTPPNEPLVSLELVAEVEVFGELQSRLHFYRTPTADDLIWIEDIGVNGLKGSAHLLTRLCLWPYSAIKALDASDLLRADRVVEGFFARGPKTGQQPSQ